MLDKNIIKKAVRNEELFGALDERERLKEIVSQLHEAISTLKTYGVAEDAINAALEKYREYAKIKKRHEAFIEDTFGITWHYWKVILKYRDATDDVIEKMSIEALSREA
jgi:hypothetical protein